ncbi:uncharacterized protein PV09_08516 [Verruconis gallopava]|uniref:C-CAP/cofactor C-like domain-containing protein n=1 Tax=Verruconis gallopava TaxID=253628 RepID=A0A0D1ZZI4_9PEZI|nr:uncharacterized protein PV09_08516 [Verruconis gallopava]KIV99847.1 hypothetical protein PV09_08516 [Verruconis gallopava]
MDHNDTSESREQRLKQFFDYFNTQLKVLNKDLEELSALDTSSLQRREGIDNLAREIQRVQEEVQDASSYTPDYDQARYAQEIRAFREKLQAARAAAASRSKFAFKSGRKIAPPAAATAAAAAEPSASTSTSSGAVDDSTDSTPTPTPTPGLKNGSAVDDRDDLSYMHIITPPTRNNEFEAIKHSVINLRHPSVPGSVPTFADLHLRHIKTSLIITGVQTGATHVTNVKNSVLVVDTHQFRMHDSKDVDVYLACATRPIIERCTRIRFAPLPNLYAQRPAAEPPRPNLWDQVDDFNWLKASRSPNWTVLPETERVTEDTWRDVVPGTEKIGLTDILIAVGVKDAEKGRSRRGSETAGGDGF